MDVVRCLGGWLHAVVLFVQQILTLALASEMGLGWMKSSEAGWMLLCGRFLCPLLESERGSGSEVKWLCAHPFSCTMGCEANLNSLVDIVVCMQSLLFFIVMA
jgi:hypothetical protein